MSVLSLTGPSGEAVGNALVLSGLTGNPSSIAAVKRAIEAIGLVHGDGVLPTINVVWEDESDLHGHYYCDEPWEVGVKEDCEHIELTVCHEVGHFIDQHGMRHRGTWASKTHNDLKPWRQVVESSPSVLHMLELIRAGSVGVNRASGSGADTGHMDIYPVDTKYLKYLRQQQELFARSYAQYIALRSGERKMLEQLNLVRQRGVAPLYYPKHWDDEEFIPIADAIEAFMVRRGWRK